MPDYYANNPYVTNPKVENDNTASFECSQDQSANSWLALAPHHPVVIQTQGFWAAVGGTFALAGLDTNKWTALTWMDWELGDASGGHAVRGRYFNDDKSENPSYSIELFNADGAVVVTLKGRGVVFRNRNFEEWREESKEEVRAKSEPIEFTYADADALGLGVEERVLVAPFDKDAGFVEALVTPANGFPPGNPMIGGSGDHVNSTHLHEIARQALCLVKGRSDIEASGEMTLKRFVELGTPLRFRLVDESERRVTFAVEQMGKTCSEISLRW